MTNPDHRRPDIPALIFGMVFVALAAWSLSGWSFDFGLETAGLVIAGVLIAVGLLGILGALRARAQR